MFEVDKLKSAIEQIWKFIVPPAINTAILLILYFYVARNSFPVIQGEVYNNLLFIKQARIQEFLTAYKLADLVPAIAILLLVFILNMTDKLLHMIGLIIPFNFSYNRTYLFYNTYDFFELAKFYPATMESGELATIIEQNGHEEKVQKSVNGQIIQAIETKGNKLMDQLSYLKSLFVLGFILLMNAIFVHSTIYDSGRLVLILIILLILMIAVLVRKAAVQLALANHLTATLFGQKLTGGDPRQSDKDSNIVKGYTGSLEKENPKTWWFFFFHYNAPQWLTVLKAFRFRYYTHDMGGIKKNREQKKVL